MRKNFISFLLAIVLIIASLSPLLPSGHSSIKAMAAASTFKDVPTSSPSYKAIMTLVERNVLSGFSDGSFKPNETVTRGQFAVMLSRALNLPKASSNFKDVPKSAALYDGISRATAAGLIKGDKGSFQPSKGVTNSDIAALLDRAMNKNGNFEETVELWYTDKGGIGKYALDSVKRMTRYGVMTGNSAHVFQPSKFANRAEASIYIYRALNLIEGTTVIPAKPVAPILKNKSAEVNEMMKSIALIQSKRSEKELLASLNSAFSSVNRAQFTNPTLTNNLTVTLAVIDRKIDYVGWKDVNGLYNAMQTGSSLDLKYLVKSDIGFSAAEMIKRIHTKASNLKKTGPVTGQDKNMADYIKVVSEDVTYMTVNQKEYDAVFTIVKEALKGYDKVVIGGEFSPYYYQFLEGERGNWDRSHPDARTKRNLGLISAEITMGDLVKAGVSKEEVIRLTKTAEIAAELTRSIHYSGPNSSIYQYDYECGCMSLTKSPANSELAYSAYDGLVRGLGSSMVYQNIDAAVFDGMGYQTKYVNHRMMFEVNGVWWNSSLKKER